MNRTKICILAGILLVACVVMLSVRGTKLRQDTASDTSPTPQQTLSNPAVETNPPVPPGSHIADTRYEEIQKSRELELERLNTARITFFGRVVDEQNRPLMGVQTRYTVHNLSFQGNPTIAGPTTDENGMFEIRANGPSLTVAVQHDGFYQGPVAELKFDYADFRKQSRSLPTLGSPAKFVLQKKGSTSSIVHHRSIEARLPLNGSPVSIDLREGGFSQRPESVFLSLIAHTESLGVNNYHPFEWQLHVTVKEGGIKVRANDFEFLAPANGYENPFTIYMSPTNNQHWSSEIDKDFFVFFPNGLYARIKLWLRADTGSCVIESYLNPDAGSRNLEFDPAKEVKSR